MTATISEDCTTITINSNFFAADNVANELTLVNSGTTYTIEVAANNTSEVVVDDESLNLEILPQGPYLITLKTTDADSNIATEQLCVTPICDLHCDMVDYYLNSENIDRILAYEALKVSQDCVTCSCTVAQKLYDKATATSNVTKCNCQQA